MGEFSSFDSAMRREVEMREFIPYTSQVTDHIVKLDSGAFLQVLRLQGAPHESADPQDINAWHDQLNGLMRNIASPQVALWSHVVRRTIDAYPAGDFSPGFAAELNRKYAERLAATSMLVNELYLTLIYQPAENQYAQLAERVVAMLRTPSQEQLVNEQLNALEVMRDIANTANAALERYEPRPLGCYEYKGAQFSEVLEFLAFLVNGEWRRFSLPKAEIRDVMAVSRPFFGASGLMALKTPTDTQYAALLTVQEWPDATCPGLLNELLAMPFELVLSQSFTFLSKPVALGRMQRQQNRLINAGDVAASQVEDLDAALDDLVSNRFVMGNHSLSLLIRANDSKRLNEHIATAGSALSDAGMKWLREEIGMAGAFWAQLPGNFKYRVRTGDITSRNFAGMSSLHNYPLGRIDNNQWGPAVAMFKTTSGAPYYFNFHGGSGAAEAFDANHKELANTIVIGKTGSGKTVLEMFLLAQTQKFSSFRDTHLGPKKLTCVVFDKDMGGAVAVRAMGGRYFPLKNGQPTGFNPFAAAGTPGNQAFLENLVCQLTRQPNMPFSAAEHKAIGQAVKAVLQSPAPLRRMSSLLQMLDPTDPGGIHARLQRWCGNGSLAWVFDNPNDTLEIDEAPIVGFDVTEFLESPETRTPIMMYLMHRVESLFDGRRVPIFMDEFSRLLDDEAFTDFSKNKLVTVRKQDGFLVMFLQDPVQALKSPIAFAIINQTATKIFLPNPTADRAAYVGGFKLTQREYDIVRELPEKSRRFLVKQGNNSVVCELDLAGMHDELAVLSGNTATSMLAERLVEQHGDEPARWLPEFFKHLKGAT